VLPYSEPQAKERSASVAKCALSYSVIWNSNALFRGVRVPICFLLSLTVHIQTRGCTELQAAGEGEITVPVTITIVAMLRWNVLFYSVCGTTSVILYSFVPLYLHSCVGSR
jgi:hypothetical protein